MYDSDANDRCCDNKEVVNHWSIFLKVKKNMIYVPKMAELNRCWLAMSLQYMFMW